MSTLLERLTYVEDEPDIRAITEFALGDIGGYTLDICANGVEALHRTQGFAPDMIILDVMMPGMDGIETLRRLREIPELETTPIVFMTAKVLATEIDQLMSLGAVDVITKPFDPIALPHRIAAIWRQAQSASVH